MVLSSGKKNYKIQNVNSEEILINSPDFLFLEGGGGGGEVDIDLSRHIISRGEKSPSQRKTTNFPGTNLCHSGQKIFKN